MSYPTISDCAGKEGVGVSSIRIIRQYKEESRTQIRYVTVYEITREALAQMFQDEYEKAFALTKWPNQAAKDFHKTVAVVRAMFLTDGMKTSTIGGTFRFQLRTVVESFRAERLYRSKIKRVPVDLDQLKLAPPVPFNSLSIRDIPETSGVYIFRAFGQILYVGSAQNFRNRFRRYFSVLIKGGNAKFEGERLLAGWQKFMTANDKTGLLTVQIIPCSRYKDVEGVLIADLDPPFNVKDERAGVDDDSPGWLARMFGR